MIWDGLVQHLVPPFDSWWSNIFASMIWSPFAAAFLAGLHWLSQRHRNKQTAHLTKQNDKIHAKQKRIEQLLVNLHEHHGIPMPEAEE